MLATVRPPRVFIPNKAAHDYTAATHYGQLVFLTEGLVNRFDVNQMTSICQEGMKDAEAGDYIMISSLSVMNSIVAAIFASRFGRLNLLLHDANTGSYISRSVIVRERRYDGDSERDA